MKYEVRDANGDLLGTLRGYEVPGHGRFLVEKPVPINLYSGLAPLDLTIPTQEVELRLDDLIWRGRLIPILVLARGKKSWLKHVKGFRAA